MSQIAENYIFSLETFSAEGKTFNLLSHFDHCNDKNNLCANFTSALISILSLHFLDGLIPKFVSLFYLKNFSVLKNEVCDQSGGNAFHWVLMFTNSQKEVTRLLLFMISVENQELFVYLVSISFFHFFVGRHLLEDKTNRVGQHALVGETRKRHRMSACCEAATPESTNRETPPLALCQPASLTSYSLSDSFLCAKTLEKRSQRAQNSRTVMV